MEQERFFGKPALVVGAGFAVFIHLEDRAR
jgi:hypothetical protein